MVEKGVKYIEKYAEDLITGKEKISYDLWEMHEGASVYSLACIYSAYDAMIKIYDELNDEFDGNRLKQETAIKEQEKLKKGQADIKKYVLEKLYDEQRKTFVRNEKDKKIDISLLGLVEPFKMFLPNEKKITNTIEHINMNLRTYTGGYLRFEWDHYTEDRPWVIATLWMALYYLEIAETKKAMECFNFVVKTATKHGFLAEQVNNNEMKSAWVIGLGWSHAMFIIVLDELIKKQII